MLGLKRGTVALCKHETDWEVEAARTIEKLWTILGSTASDIRHVGSTSVPSIMAKPIIDIAVAASSFDAVMEKADNLRNAGFYYCPKCETEWQRLFACGSYYNGTGDLQTHFIHVVMEESSEFRNYIIFSSYLRKHPSIAREYESLKLSLAAKNPVDGGREKYLAGKHDFIVRTLRAALSASMLGKNVSVIIDRPIGFVHKNDSYTIIYPINCGFIPNIIGGNIEVTDVYILGVNSPIERFNGKIIAVIHRDNDVEDKLVAAQDGVTVSEKEIVDAVFFQERFHKSRIEMLNTTI